MKSKKLAPICKYLGDSSIDTIYSHFDQLPIEQFKNKRQEKQFEKSKNKKLQILD